MKKAGLPYGNTCTRVPESRCNHCFAKVTAASADGPESPNPGDASICCYCGGLNVFNDELCLRLPNEADFAEIASKPELRDDIARKRRILEQQRAMDSGDKPKWTN